MARRYPKELHEFMAQFVPGHSCREIAAEVESRFGIIMTLNEVKCYKNNHKIRSGTRCGIEAGKPTLRFPAEVAEYIRQNHEGTGPTAMAVELNRIFGSDYTAAQIKSFYHNHKISSGLTGYFEKGSVPPNKGKKGMRMPPQVVRTQFKTGHTPANKLPIGTVLRKDDGYLWRKTGEGARDWKQEHIILWEEANGKLPEGYVVIFLDGDRENLKPENLRAISKQVHCILNSKHLRTGDRELTATGIMVAELSIALRKHKNEKKKGNAQRKS